MLCCGVMTNFINSIIKVVITPTVMLDLTAIFPWVNLNVLNRYIDEYYVMGVKNRLWGDKST